MDTEPQTLHDQLNRLNRSLSRYTTLRTEAQAHRLSAWERYFHAQEQQLSAKINRLSRRLVPKPPEVPERAAADGPSRQLRAIIRSARPVAAAEDGARDASPPLRLENPPSIRSAWRGA